jgi:hypothetical protein
VRTRDESSAPQSTTKAKEGLVASQLDLRPTCSISAEDQEKTIGREAGDAHAICRKDQAPS